MTNLAMNENIEAQDELQNMANAIRVLSMDAVQAAKSGHPGMPMGMADVASVLFAKFLKFDAKNPKWADRDRFVLSAGHGSMLLYSLLYLTGYEDISLDDIKDFRKLHSKTCGHPEFGELAGIETTTGPLGQGIANAVGMAIAEKHLAAKFGADLVDHHTYTIVGDGCLMEGISHEAISMAGHLKLDKLIVLFDDNHICIDGPTEMTVTDNQPARFKASGWDVAEIDGHDFAAIEAAIEAAKKSDKPSMIACRTIIGKFAPTKADSSGCHGAPLGAEEIAGAKAAMGWESTQAFDIPDNVMEAWAEAGTKNADDFASWTSRLASSEQKAEFERLQNDELPSDYKQAFLAVKKQFSQSSPMATRKSSGQVLAGIVGAIPELVGGSADLTGSNLTKTPDMKPITPQDFSGNYMYYGVREHAMCAAMNGMTLHKGIIPFGGTFFVFTDYCRPSIRLAALMKQRAIYVMTHDSIGLGEDGPTHQPVEHLSSLRAMPNLYVFRPADATETLESWQLAVEKKDAPSMLVLTRQNVPNLRPEYVEENKTARGAYVISDALTPSSHDNKNCHPADNKNCHPALVAGSEAIEGDSPLVDSPIIAKGNSGNDGKTVTIIATGSEVEIALDAQAKLAKSGIAAKVVSMPCAELFDEQPAEYQQEILGDGLVAAIEAGIGYGWEKYIGRNGVFVGMKGFGASAPANELYEYFGITADNLVKQVIERLPPHL